MTFPADFRRITSREALIVAIGTDKAKFNAVLAFDPPTSQEEQREAARRALKAESIADVLIFFRHDIPKRNRKRGCRTVWEPLLAKPEYKALARRLETFFRIALPGYLHDAVYGYRPGRNIRENAGAHAGHAALLATDLQDFFPSISKDRIAQLFEALGIVPSVADLLARFVPIGGALPLGLPTSPVISNAIALPLDLACEALAKSMDATYTRYADDLTFSGNAGLPELDAIRQLVKEQGFLLAEQKTRRSKIGQAHYVTGLSISDARPHVPRARKRRLRQELYYAGKFGVADHLRHLGVNDPRVVQQEVNRIDGTVRFVAHHEPTIATQLKTCWRAALQAEGMKPSFAPRGQHRAPFYLFIDEAEFERGSRKILAIGMTVSQHGPRMVTEGQQVLAAALADVFLDGDAEALRKRGLHYVDVTEDLRIEYIKRLAGMRFEGYVAFAEYDGPNSYEETYLRLLGAMIQRRLKAAESQFAFLYFEQNDKVSAAKVEALVQHSFDELKARNDRRPAGFSIQPVSKPHLGISAPDFLLGVLGKYLKSKPAPLGKPEPRDRPLFERLRDKYRLILDLTTWTEYSRRRPILPWSDAKRAAASSGANE
ncbi:reverse transcriptase family protein [Mesorhizobium sp. BHbsci]